MFQFRRRRGGRYTSAALASYSGASEIMMCPHSGQWPSPRPSWHPICPRGISDIWIWSYSIPMFGWVCFFIICVTQDLRERSPYNQVQLAMYQK